jgi:hypothetical protein
MALSKLLAGLRATRLGAVAAAAALATTSVVAASAALPEQAADQAQEALDHAAQAPDDTDNGDLDNDLDNDTDNGDTDGEDNGRSADVHAVLGGGEFTPEDGDLFGQAVADQARDQEQGSFGQAVAAAARGDDADDEEDNGEETEERDVPPANLPEQADKGGDNAGDARP